MNRRNRGKSQSQRGKKTFRGGGKTTKFSAKKKSKLSSLTKDNTKEIPSLECSSKLRDTGSSKNDGVLSKEPTNSIGISTRLMEKDVGITEYVSKHEGFSGIIKQRLSDFHVNEIDCDGNVVTLTTTSIPELAVDVSDAKEKAEENMKDVLPKETIEKLKQLLESNGEDVVEIEVSHMNKEDRRKLHRAIVNCGKSRLDSNTKERDGKKYIIITKHKLNAKPDRRVAWPAERGGDYVQFVLHKENMDTMETVNDIANKLRIKPNLIGYAGTKDRRAKTSQLMSIKRMEPSRLVMMTRNLRGITLGNYSFKTKGLKLGDLCGNRFRVVLRNVTGTDTQIKEAMTSLKDRGFLNYYGLQRFGNSYSVPTYEIGKALLQSNWKEAVELILKPREGEQSRDLVEARKVWWETRDATRAHKLLRNKEKMIEGKLLLGLSRYGANNYVDALNNIPRNTCLLYMHSYQSLVWNKVVSRRVAQYGLKALAGDLVLVGEGSKTEIVDQPVEEEAANTAEASDENSSSKKQAVRMLTEKDLPNVQIYDIVLPLPGHDITYPANITGEWMKELLKKDGLELLSRKPGMRRYSVGGAYRHLVIRPTNMSWKTMRYSDPQTALVLSDLEEMQCVAIPKDDPDGLYKALILDFCLPSSTYATMALREILKADTSTALQASLNDYHTSKSVDDSKENGAGKVNLGTESVENGSVIREGPSKMKTRRNSAQKSDSLAIKIKGKGLVESAALTLKTDKGKQEDTKSVDDSISMKRTKVVEGGGVAKGEPPSTKTKGKRTSEHLDASVVKLKDPISSKKARTLESNLLKVDEICTVKTRAKRSSDHLDVAAADMEEMKEEAKSEVEECASTKKIKNVEIDLVPVKTRARTTAKHIDVAVESEEALKQDVEDTSGIKKTRSKTVFKAVELEIDNTEAMKMELEDNAEFSSTKTRTRSKTLSKLRDQPESTKTCEETKMDTEDNIPDNPSIRTRSKLREVPDGRSNEDLKVEIEDSTPDNPSVRTRSKLRDAPESITKGIDETKMDVEGTVPIPDNPSVRTRSKVREAPEGNKINEEMKIDSEDSIPESPPVRKRSKFREAPDVSKTTEETKGETEDGIPDNPSVRTRSKLRDIPEGNKIDEVKVDSEDSMLDNPSVRTRSKLRDLPEGNKYAEEIKIDVEDSVPDNPSVRTRSKLREAIECAKSGEDLKVDSDDNTLDSIPVRTRSKATLKSRDSPALEGDGMKDEEGTRGKSERSITPSKTELLEMVKVDDKPSVRTRSRTITKLRDSATVESEGGTEDEDTANISPTKGKPSARTRPKRYRDSPVPDNDDKGELAVKLELDDVGATKLDDKSPVRTRSKVLSKVRDSSAIDVEVSKEVSEGTDNTSSVRTRSKASSRSRDSPALEKLVVKEVEEIKPEISGLAEETSFVKTRRSVPKAPEVVNPNVEGNKEENIAVDEGSCLSDKNSNSLEKERVNFPRIKSNLSEVKEEIVCDLQSPGTSDNIEEGKNDAPKLKVYSLESTNEGSSEHLDAPTLKMEGVEENVQQSKSELEGSSETNKSAEASLVSESIDVVEPLDVKNKILFEEGKCVANIETSEIAEVCLVKEENEGIEPVDVKNKKGFEISKCEPIADMETNDIPKASSIREPLGSFEIIDVRNETVCEEKSETVASIETKRITDTSMVMKDIEPADVKKQKFELNKSESDANKEAAITAEISSMKESVCVEEKAQTKEKRVPLEESIEGETVIAKAGKCEDMEIEENIPNTDSSAPEVISAQPAETLEGTDSENVEVKKNYQEIEEGSMITEEPAENISKEPISGECCESQRPYDGDKAVDSDVSIIKLKVEEIDDQVLQTDSSSDIEPKDRDKKEIPSMVSQHEQGQEKNGNFSTKVQEVMKMKESDELSPLDFKMETHGSSVMDHPLEGKSDDLSSVEDTKDNKGELKDGEVEFCESSTSKEVVQTVNKTTLKEEVDVCEKATSQNEMGKIECHQNVGAAASVSKISGESAVEVMVHSKMEFVPDNGSLCDGTTGAKIESLEGEASVDKRLLIGTEAEINDKVCNTKMDHVNVDDTNLNSDRTTVTIKETLTVADISHAHSECSTAEDTLAKDGYTPINAGATVSREMLTECSIPSRQVDNCEQSDNLQSSLEVENSNTYAGKYVMVGKLHLTSEKIKDSVDIDSQGNEKAELGMREGSLSESAVANEDELDKGTCDVKTECPTKDINLSLIGKTETLSESIRKTDECVQEHKMRDVMADDNIPNCSTDKIDVEYNLLQNSSSKIIKKETVLEQKDDIDILEKQDSDHNPTEENMEIDENEVVPRECDRSGSSFSENVLENSAVDAKEAHRILLEDESEPTVQSDCISRRKDDTSSMPQEIEPLVVAKVGDSVHLMKNKGNSIEVLIETGITIGSATDNEQHSMESKSENIKSETVSESLQNHKSVLPENKEKSVKDGGQEFDSVAVNRSRSNGTSDSNPPVVSSEITSKTNILKVSNSPMEDMTSDQNVNSEQIKIAETDDMDVESHDTEKKLPESNLHPAVAEIATTQLTSIDKDCSVTEVGFLGPLVTESSKSIISGDPETEKSLTPELFEEQHDQVEEHTSNDTEDKTLESKCEKSMSPYPPQNTVIIASTAVMLENDEMEEQICESDGSSANTTTIPAACSNQGDDPMPEIEVENKKSKLAVASDPKHSSDILRNYTTMEKEPFSSLSPETCVHEDRVVSILEHSGNDGNSTVQNTPKLCSELVSKTANEVHTEQKEETLPAKSSIMNEDLVVCVEKTNEIRQSDTAGTSSMDKTDLPVSKSKVEKCDNTSGLILISSVKPAEIGTTELESPQSELVGKYLLGQRVTDTSGTNIEDKTVQTTNQTSVESGKVMEHFPENRGSDAKCDASTSLKSDDLPTAVDTTQPCETMCKIPKGATDIGLTETVIREQFKMETDYVSDTDSRGISGIEGQKYSPCVGTTELKNVDKKQTEETKSEQQEKEVVGEITMIQGNVCESQSAMEVDEESAVTNISLEDQSTKIVESCSQGPNKPVCIVKTSAVINEEVKGVSINIQESSTKQENIADEVDSLTRDQLNLNKDELKDSASEQCLSSSVNGDGKSLCVRDLESSEKLISLQPSNVTHESKDFSKTEGCELTSAECVTTHQERTTECVKENVGNENTVKMKDLHTSEQLEASIPKISLEDKKASEPLLEAEVEHAVPDEKEMEKEDTKVVIKTDITPNVGDKLQMDIDLSSDMMEGQSCSGMDIETSGVVSGDENKIKDKMSNINTNFDISSKFESQSEAMDEAIPQENVGVASLQTESFRKSGSTEDLEQSNIAEEERKIKEQVPGLISEKMNELQVTVGHAEEMVQSVAKESNKFCDFSVSKNSLTGQAQNSSHADSGEPVEGSKVIEKGDLSREQNVLVNKESHESTEKKENVKNMSTITALVSDSTKDLSEVDQSCDSDIRQSVEYPVVPCDQNIDSHAMEKVTADEMVVEMPAFDDQTEKKSKSSSSDQVNETKECEILDTKQQVGEVASREELMECEVKDNTKTPISTEQCDEVIVSLSDKAELTLPKETDEDKKQEEKICKEVCVNEIFEVEKCDVGSDSFTNNTSEVNTQPEIEVSPCRTETSVELLEEIGEISENDRVLDSRKKIEKIDSPQIDVLQNTKPNVNQNQDEVAVSVTKQGSVSLKQSPELSVGEEALPVMKNEQKSACNEDKTLFSMEVDEISTSVDRMNEIVEESSLQKSMEQNPNTEPVISSVDNTTTSVLHPEEKMEYSTATEESSSIASVNVMPKELHGKVSSDLKSCPSPNIAEEVKEYDDCASKDEVSIEVKAEESVPRKHETENCHNSNEIPSAVTPKASVTDSGGVLEILQQPTKQEQCGMGSRIDPMLVEIKEEQLLDVEENHIPRITEKKGEREILVTATQDSLEMHEEKFMPSNMRDTNSVTSQEEISKTTACTEEGALPVPITGPLNTQHDNELAVVAVSELESEQCGINTANSDECMDCEGTGGVSASESPINSTSQDLSEKLAKQDKLILDPHSSTEHGDVTPQKLPTETCSENSEVETEQNLVMNDCLNSDAMTECWHKAAESVSENSEMTQQNTGASDSILAPDSKNTEEEPRHSDKVTQDIENGELRMMEQSGCVNKCADSQNVKAIAVQQNEVSDDGNQDGSLKKAKNAVTMCNLAIVTVSNEVPLPEDVGEPMGIEESEELTNSNEVASTDNVEDVTEQKDAASDLDCLAKSDTVTNNVNENEADTAPMEQTELPNTNEVAVIGNESETGNKVAVTESEGETSNKVAVIENEAETVATEQSEVTPECSLVANASCVEKHTVIEQSRIASDFDQPADCTSVVPTEECRSVSSSYITTSENVSDAMAVEQNEVLCDSNEVSENVANAIEMKENEIVHETNFVQISGNLADDVAMEQNEVLCHANQVATSDNVENATTMEQNEVIHKFNQVATSENVRDDMAAEQNEVCDSDQVAVSDKKAHSMGMEQNEATLNLVAKSEIALEQSEVHDSHQVSVSGNVVDAMTKQSEVAPVSEIAPHIKATEQSEFVHDSDQVAGFKNAANAITAGQSEVGPDCSEIAVPLAAADAMAVEQSEIVTDSHQDEVSENTMDASTVQLGEIVSNSDQVMFTNNTTDSVTEQNENGTDIASTAQSESIPEKMTNAMVIDHNEVVPDSNQAFDHPTDVSAMKGNEAILESGHLASEKGADMTVEEDKVLDCGQVATSENVAGGIEKEHKKIVSASIQIGASANASDATTENVAGNIEIEQSKIILASNQIVVSANALDADQSEVSLVLNTVVTPGNVTKLEPAENMHCSKQDDASTETRTKQTSNLASNSDILLKYDSDDIQDGKIFLGTIVDIEQDTKNSSVSEPNVTILTTGTDKCEKNSELSTQCKEGSSICAVSSLTSSENAEEIQTSEEHSKIPIANVEGSVVTRTADLSVAGTETSAEMENIESEPVVNAEDSEMEQCLALTHGQNSISTSKEETEENEMDHENTCDTGSVSCGRENPEYSSVSDVKKTVKIEDAENVASERIVPSLPKNIEEKVEKVPEKCEELYSVLNSASTSKEDMGEKATEECATSTSALDETVIGSKQEGELLEKSNPLENTSVKEVCMVQNNMAEDPELSVPAEGRTSDIDESQIENQSDFSDEKNVTNALSLGSCKTVVLGLQKSECTSATNQGNLVASVEVENPNENMKGLGELATINSAVAGNMEEKTVSKEVDVIPLSASEENNENVQTTATQDPEDKIDCGGSSQDPFCHSIESENTVRDCDLTVRKDMDETPGLNLDKNCSQANDKVTDTDEPSSSAKHKGSSESDNGNYVERSASQEAGSLNHSSADTFSSEDKGNLLPIEIVSVTHEKLQSSNFHNQEREATEVSGAATLAERKDNCNIEDETKPILAVDMLDGTQADISCSTTQLHDKSESDLDTQKEGTDDNSEKLTEILNIKQNVKDVAVCEKIDTTSGQSVPTSELEHLKTSTCTSNLVCVSITKMKSAEERNGTGLDGEASTSVTDELASSTKANVEIEHTSKEAVEGLQECTFSKCEEKGIDACTKESQCTDKVTSEGEERNNSDASETSSEKVGLLEMHSCANVESKSPVDSVSQTERFCPEATDDKSFEASTSIEEGSNKETIGIKRKAEESCSVADSTHTLAKKVRLPGSVLVPMQKEQEEVKHDATIKRKADGDHDCTEDSEIMGKKVRLNEKDENKLGQENGSSSVEVEQPTLTETSSHEADGDKDSDSSMEMKDGVLKRKVLEADSDDVEAKKAKLDASDAPE